MKKISIAIFVAILIVIFLLYRNFPYKNESKIIQKDSGEKFLVEYDPMTDDVIETLIEESGSEEDKVVNNEWASSSRHNSDNDTNDVRESLSKLDRDQEALSEEDDIDKRLEEVIKAREKKEKEIAEKRAREKAEQKAKEKAEQKAKEKAEQKAREEANEKDSSTKIDRIVKFARSKLGKPFKRAGVTDQGYDCSGLVMTSFARCNVRLPRASFQMARKGQSISVKNINKGDLLFFTINSVKSKSVNHVALVTKVKEGVVYFVHSRERSGVIENTLKEGYYRKRLLKVRRYIK